MTSDKVILKTEFAFARVDDCPCRGVAHGNDSMPDADRPAKLCSDLCQRRPLAKPMRAVQVCSKIPVAELKPICCAKPAKRVHAAPGLVGQPPAALCVVQAGERVHHGIEIG